MVCIDLWCGALEFRAKATGNLQITIPEGQSFSVLPGAPGGQVKMLTARRKIVLTLLVLILLVLTLATDVFTNVRRVFKRAPPTAAKTSPTRLDDIPDTDHGLIRFDECPPPPINLPDILFHEPTSRSNLHLPSTDYLPRCRPRTPLFIAFASQQCLLYQVVVSFIAEGWPASQIVIFDNSGQSAKNVEGSSPSDHPSTLNYTTLLTEYGVAVFQLRVRLTFAQLQNTWLDIAKQSNMSDYYWAHQDIVVRSFLRDPAYRFFYHGILEEQTLLASKNPQKWAFGFHNYDLLSHVNVRVADRVGLWDDRIPYYPTDCDYCSRARHDNLMIYDYEAGMIYDVASCLANVNSLLLHPATHDYGRVTEELVEMQSPKLRHRDGRNLWQGYDRAYSNLEAASRQQYRLKYKTDDCDARL